MEAADHRGQEGIGLKVLEVEGMPGLSGEKDQEDRLSAAVAIAERMGAVHLGEQMSSADDEGLFVDAAQKAGLPQLTEDASQFRKNVLGVAERAVALADADRAEASCPAVHVLEDVVVDRPVVRDAPPPAGMGSMKRRPVATASKRSSSSWDRRPGRFLRTPVPE